VGLSRALRLYASLFAFALIAFLMLTLFAVRKRWPVLSWSVRSIARIPSLKSWIEKRYLMVQSVENALFDFHHKTPQAFWGSFSLNLAAQCMAVSEVCLILWLMGVKIGFFSALVIEALTKLVNVLGNFNPGNIGTYEGGTMLIGKMFGLSSATGLASFGIIKAIAVLFLGRGWHHLFHLADGASRKHRWIQDPREHNRNGRDISQSAREFPKQPFTAKRNRVRHFPRRRRGHKQPIQRSTLSSRHAANPAPNDTRSAKGRS